METFKDFLADYYLIIKSLHLISVISWMAGMLYLPRLFVYHCDAPVGSLQSETFKIMERRLLRGIINPAMVATFVFGLMLTVTPGIVVQPMGWFHAKILLLIFMTGAHGAMSRWRKDFEADRNQKSARFFRIANETPTVLMIIIVFLVVLKPF